jgi:hypothetical protein
MVLHLVLFLKLSVTQGRPVTTDCLPRMAKRDAEAWVALADSHAQLFLSEIGGVAPLEFY